MAQDYTRLKLEQTEELLRPFRRIARTSAPRSGWVRAIREALGMSAVQLAARLNVTRQSIENLERNEVSGKITLESLNKLAGAMNCRVVYALVPEQPLAAIQLDRARVLADALMKPDSHSMTLENQPISKREERRHRERLVQTLLQGKPRKLWDWSSNILLNANGAEPFDWGEDLLAAPGEVRDRYIAALRAADDHAHAPLLTFVRSGRSA